MWGHGSHSAIVNGSYGASKDLGLRAALDLKARCYSREDLMDENSGLKAHRKLRVQDPECRLQRLAFVEFRAYDATAVELGCMCLLNMGDSKGIFGSYGYAVAM